MVRVKHVCTKYACPIRGPRGQTFLIDMFVFLTATIFILILFVFMLSTTNNYKTQDGRMQRAVETAANILISQGHPSNWEANVSEINILGLADRRGRIEQAKLAALNRTEYVELLSMSPYNVSISLLRDDTTIYSTGWINSSARVAVSDRIVVYNGSVCVLRVMASEEIE
ncbi:MAG: hypothetical protein QW112_01970 [Candidatus Micrarchaeia archaeon]